VVELKQIYRPIARELELVEELLASAVKATAMEPVLRLSQSAVQTKGKRIRPALVLLSGRIARNGRRDHCRPDELVHVAAAMELVHIASLIHDDTIDRAVTRHSRPSVNKQLGDDVSIALGDYLHSKALSLISSSRRPELFECITEAFCAMCEGELIQVCQRKNLELSKESYLVIAEKKTASLFAACCQAGTILGNQDGPLRAALREFGLNFGIAFQIIDDTKDIISEEKTLGKRPGQDLAVGDITLPLLSLLEVVEPREQEKLKEALHSRASAETIIEDVRTLFLNSKALDITKATALEFIERAKRRLAPLENSDYKDSLVKLADYIINKLF